MSDTPDPSGGHESRDARQEELARLLESLRVLLPGIQVLFAFLLTVPYSSRFASQGDFQEIALYATLAFAALSIMFLLTPLVAYRQHYPDVTMAMIRRWNILVIVGYVFLGLALVGAVVTLTELIWEAVWAVVVAGGIASALLVVLWVVLPRRGD